MNRLYQITAAVLPLASCGNPQPVNPSQQIGSNPVLPKPAEELVAAVGVPKTLGWKGSETPTVPPGFKIEALATGLSNPRNVLALPDGDILVVESQRVGSEPVERPKDPIRDFIMKCIAIRTTIRIEALRHFLRVSSHSIPPARTTSSDRP